MQIDTRHIVLRVLDELGERPNGKTYLQKLCFFVGKVLGQELGFRAHYYGPYSDQVSGDIGFLNANGYAYESRKRSGVSDRWGWEVTRFDYRLSERGTEAIEWLERTRPEESRRIRDAIQRVLSAGDLNYVRLSLAAKTCWILADEGRPMTFDRVAEKAQQFGWKVQEDDVKSAADFLEKLHLTTVVESQVS